MYTSSCTMDNISLKCPNCSAILPAELKKDLYAGKEVTCENCGILIIPKTPSRGERPLPSRISPREGFVGHSTLGGPAPRPQKQPEPSWIVPSHAPETESPRGSPFDAEALRQKLPRYRNFIMSYNDVSMTLMKIILSIFLVVSSIDIIITLFFGYPLLQWSVMQLHEFLSKVFMYAWFYILGAFMYWYDKKKVHPWVKRGQFDFYGIDLVVIGIASMGVFGLGVLPFLKGIFIMAYMVAEDKVNAKSKRDALIGWINGLDEVSWQAVAVAALTGFGFFLYALIIISQFSAIVIGFFVVAIAGTISANADRHSVSPYIHEYQFSGLGGKTLVNSIIGMMCFGAGVPMFFKAVLLFVLEEEDKKSPPVTTKHVFPAQVPPAVAHSGSQEGLMISTVPVVGSGRTVVQGGSPSTKDTIPPASVKVVPKPAPYLPAKNPGSIEAYLHRSFSVLTPKVRRRLVKLKKLGLSGEDIAAIADELVYHPEFEQLEIIDQYIALNKEDEVDPMYVLTVRNMTYPDEMKQWIMSQLKIIKDDDVPAFLDEMQKAQPR